MSVLHTGKIEWKPEADQKLRRVPFFIRGTVRKMAEDYARSRNAAVVDAALLDDARAEYFKKVSRAAGTSSPEKLHVLDVCKGSDLGCPFALRSSAQLAEELTRVLESSYYLRNLKDSLDDLMLPHHRFQVSISSCPNSCSQPQIRDFGLQAVSFPGVSGKKCSGCRRCIESCREGAITLSETGRSIEFDKCIGCGSCHRVCPTGTLAPDKEGYFILIGGKLGRHPRLATRLQGVFEEKSVPAVLAKILQEMAERSMWGKRLGELLEREPGLYSPAYILS
jgi:dissimilatory sulfite reductase (desulfoviridin) alpha/beta subunit